MDGDQTVKCARAPAIAVRASRLRPLPCRSPTPSPTPSVQISDPFLESDIQLSDPFGANLRPLPGAWHLALRPLRCKSPTPSMQNIRPLFDWKNKGNRCQHIRFRVDSLFPIPRQRKLCFFPCRCRGVGRPRQERVDAHFRHRCLRCPCRCRGLGRPRREKVDAQFV